ncbi:MAG: DUF4276 family protein [Bacteroidota bacterium]|nr:DUF4276 family protein [Rhodothermia bacterium]MDW8285724.1 DUF4276 family protein [Bacteroidota bacterium]
MSHPFQVICFCEDIAHERFITALIQRAAAEEHVKVHIKVLNATHGSRVWPEFRQYVRELQARIQPLPDVLVAVMDGNCKKASQVRRDIEREVKQAGLAIPHLVCAVPDPHIERWYLEDQKALKGVLPKAQPEKIGYKCERDRYKQALVEAIRAAEVEPLLGGAEYGEDIARALDPSRLDQSFQSFWQGLRRAFRQLSGGQKEAGHLQHS